MFSKLIISCANWDQSIIFLYSVKYQRGIRIWLWVESFIYSCIFSCVSNTADTHCIVVVTDRSHTDIPLPHLFTLLRFWMLVWWTQQSWMLLKQAMKVKPDELDQTNVDFSTIIYQLNTQCPSGYIIRVHDIITTRLWLVWYWAWLISFTGDWVSGVLAVV